MKKIIGSILICIVYCSVVIAAKYPLSQSALEDKISAELSAGGALHDTWQQGDVWIGLGENETYPYIIFFAHRLPVISRYRLEIYWAFNPWHMTEETVFYMYEIEWGDGQLTVRKQDTLFTKPFILFCTMGLQITALIFWYLGRFKKKDE